MAIEKLSHPIRTVPPMSCIDLTTDHREVLDLLAPGQPVPEHLAGVMEESVRWGWALSTGELTGVGLAHAGEEIAGRVGIHDHPHSRNQ